MPEPASRRWVRDDYTGGSVQLARRLIGAMLVRTLESGETLVGRIVETEAYCGVRDAASHAYRGRRTPRNEAMYAQPGTAYVYFTYGMHWCFNVVCGREGVPLAVLVRALEPVQGLETMRRLRGGSSRSPLAERELCSGPARLCQALAIDRALNGTDLTADPRIFVADPFDRRARTGLVRAPRIGIGYAGPWVVKPLRFLVPGSSHVSRPPPAVKPGKRRKR